MADFSAGEFLRLFGSKLFNVLGGNRELYCLSCKNHTVHHSLSYGEIAQYDDENKSEILKSIGAISGRIDDYNPKRPLMQGNPYYCSVCRRIKYQGGLISDILNKENKKWNT
ncbi:hypothetical protein H6G81_22905 [Scytonema hofmannii FACHB-248]|uniref:Uncharacterized protein n=1 Tax=Scytonema hofmannii FACHB-248 TaxID=1842502 RepID=A0ABR8GVZ9_9CYAN|nr:MULTISPECIES: hypothetical protein [Nostocales]MBD2607300.1 hypothetical protein [Scytonema hofmannii FACHB-248]